MSNAAFVEDDEFVMIGRRDENFLPNISEDVDALSRELREVSLQIHDNPELQYKELHAHEVLTKYMEGKAGWRVTRSAYDIQTAFAAVYESHSGPTVSFNAEYDALKGIGHACGHNLIAVASVAGALATAMTMEKYDLGGKVVLFGTPAEEGGGGKIKLLDRRAYKEHNVDISLISHPGVTSDSALMRTTAYSCFKVEYHGKEAHAAAAPWEGINALVALITAWHITDGGLRTNIIHAYSSDVFVVRSTTRERLKALKKRVKACFAAGATATGATLTITAKGSYLDHMPNKRLGPRFRAAFNELGGDIHGEDIDLLTGTVAASTDQGNTSYALPSISPNFWIWSGSKDDPKQQGGGPHTLDFERASRTLEAHEKALRVGKALSATAVNVLTSPRLLKEIQQEFKGLRS